MGRGLKNSTVPLPLPHCHIASAIIVLCLCRCSTVCGLRGYYIYTVPVQDYACAAAAVPATASTALKLARLTLTALLAAWWDALHPVAQLALPAALPTWPALLPALSSALLTQLTLPAPVSIASKAGATLLPPGATPPPLPLARTALLAALLSVQMLNRTSASGCSAPPLHPPAATSQERNMMCCTLPASGRYRMIPGDSKEGVGWEDGEGAADLDGWEGVSAESMCVL